MIQQTPDDTKSTEGVEELRRACEKVVTEAFTYCPVTYIEDGRLIVQGDRSGEYSAKLEKFNDAGVAAKTAMRLIPSLPLNKPKDHWLGAEDERTDNSLATRFIAHAGEDLRYVPPWRKWLVWDGRRFKLDEGSTLVLSKGRDFAKSLWHELAKFQAVNTDESLQDVVASYVKGSNRGNAIKTFLDLAKADRRVITEFESLNANPKLLNCLNGTYDLENGDFTAHLPTDLITQLANVRYEPGATCPKWEGAVDLIFDGDTDLVRYVRQMLGYSLSGDTGEHILPIAWGKGNNGKSTIWNTVLELAGDYGTLANDSLLLGDKNSHPTDKAQLYQKRIVAISEPEQGSQMRESRVKELTGDSFITARRMREDFWTFRRTHTFWLSTNHLPRVKGTDTGIWRRIKLIPFKVNLSDKVDPIKDFHLWLAEYEGPGILNWLLAGYHDYQANGFVEPVSVREAGETYKGDEDHVGRFVDECCQIGEPLSVGASKLYDAYKRWGGHWSATAFGKEMSERYTKQRTNRGNVYSGIAERFSSSAV